MNSTTVDGFKVTPSMIRSLLESAKIDGSYVTNVGMTIVPDRELISFNCWLRNGTQATLSIPKGKFNLRVPGRNE